MDNLPSFLIYYNRKYFISVKNNPPNFLIYYLKFFIFLHNYYRIVKRYLKISFLNILKCYTNICYKHYPYKKYILFHLYHPRLYINISIRKMTFHLTYSLYVNNQEIYHNPLFREFQPAWQPAPNISSDNLPLTVEIP